MWFFKCLWEEFEVVKVGIFLVKLVVIDNSVGGD